MPYSLAQVEVTSPVPALAVQPGDDGIAIVVRRAGRPVGFVMQPAAAGQELSSRQVEELIGRSCGVKLLQEGIRDQLGIAAEPWTPPRVSIAICTKDNPAILERLLESLARMEQGAGGDPPEILVVDNAPSDDRTRTVCERFPGTRYFMEPKVGLNFARNRALREASGAVLAFLDDDVVVDRGWLLGVYEALRENPDARAVTGLVLPFELATEAQVLFEAHGGFRRGFDKLRHRPRAWPEDPLYPCGAGSFGAGCNMLFRRDTLLDLGGFDEALDTGAPLPGGGDLDIFYRVVRSGGLLVYEPSALAFHQHRREMPKLRRQYWTWGLGFMAFVEKSYRSDPAYRPHLRRTVNWWMRDQARRLYRGLRGRHALPAPLLAAELVGGVVGLTGAYTRSRRRTDRIRAEHS